MHVKTVTYACRILKMIDVEEAACFVGASYLATPEVFPSSIAVRDIQTCTETLPAGESARR